MNARLAALEILMRYEKEGSKLDPLLLDVTKKSGAEEARDKAFIKKLVEGVVERLITLDYVTDLAASVKTAKMKPVIRMIIRLGAYQILFMDRVPVSAAVNESVKLAGIKGAGGLKGFVNGVLRGIAGLKEKGIEYPDSRTECSFPEWIAKILTDRYGAETAEKMMRAGVGRMPLYLRVNRCRIDTEDLKRILSDRGIETKIVKPYTLRVLSGDLIPAEDESFLAGMYSVQDLSSQTAMYELWERAKVYINTTKTVNINVLDLCAAPGGKTCFMAEAIEGNTDLIQGSCHQITSCDISEKKLEKIRENLERTEIGNVEVRIKDALEYDPGLEKSADIIIADLPCSGLGVLGRKVDIKYRVKPGDIRSLCELQRGILDNAPRYLKPGGILLFSVCTVTMEETVQQTDYITKKGLHKLEERQLLQGVDDCDGFYYALFDKPEK